MLSKVMQVLVKNTTNQQIIIHRARWCNSFICRLRGLTFRRELNNNALILVEQTDSRIATMIHMMFVFFPIAVIWINQNGQIVDACLAKPFRLLYIPRSPARYVLEGDLTLLDKISTGDNIEFVPVA
ncbi:MAG: DUF192 domain-containing protein [Anaerolineales bacterium]|nr:DUF192 domain-containing protein [Anaerolineales bacterium]